MSDRESKHTDRTRQIVDRANDTEIIPFDGFAFWAQLRRILSDRFPTCATDEGCVIWLVDHCSGGKPGDDTRETDRRKFKRWSKGGCPRWENVYPLCAAINTASPGLPKLTTYDLVDGLPLREPGRDDRSGDDSGDDDPPGGAPPPPGDNNQGDLARLKAEVEAILNKESALTRALARKLGPGVKGMPRAVALALIDAPANRVAEVLAELAGTPEHRRAARHLFWHILPLAGDWDDVLKKAQMAGSKVDVLELQLRTATLAEIVLARLDARCCVFAPGGEFPQGAAHVPLPAVMDAPIFDAQGERLVEAVLMNLWHEHSLEDRLPGEETWRAMKKECADESEFMAVATAEINTRTLQERRRYLLFIDAMLGPSAQGRDLEQMWTVARQALGKALPGLRVVRLKGRHKEMANEAGLRTIVKRVRDLA